MIVYLINIVLLYRPNLRKYNDAYLSHNTAKSTPVNPNLQMPFTSIPYFRGAHS